MEKIILDNFAKGPSLMERTVNATSWLKMASMSYQWNFCTTFSTVL